jgi:hypothetical protein
MRHTDSADVLKNRQSLKEIRTKNPSQNAPCGLSALWLGSVLVGVERNQAMSEETEPLSNEDARVLRAGS